MGKMMKNFRGLFTMEAIAVAFGAQTNFATRLQEKQPIVEIIPVGCKKYYFNDYGGFDFQKSDETVFECVARSRERARAKFEKWADRQTLSRQAHHSRP
jgi:hypothetical protein